MARKRKGVEGPFIRTACLNCGKESGGKTWKNIGVCKGCRYCKACGCHCRACVSCGKRHGFVGDCVSCRRCRTTCTCRQRPGWYKGIDTLKQASLPVTARVINSLHRPLSVEVELAEWRGVERWGGGEYFTYQRIHDGSVVPSGNEMVSSPMVGDQAVLGLAELGAELARKGATINNTCGFHVHVDATDFSYLDIRRLLYLYTMFEDEIYNYLILPERANNRFCRKLDAVSRKCLLNSIKTNETSKVKDHLYNMVFGTVPKDFYRGQLRPEHAFGYKSTAHELKSSKYGGHGGDDRRRIMRYMGFNIYSWFHRGSVEFRMKEGLLDPVDMIAWTLFCGWIVESAFRLDDSILQKKVGLFDFLRKGVGTVKPPDFLYAWAMGKVRSRDEE